MSSLTPSSDGITGDVVVLPPSTTDPDRRLAGEVAFYDGDTSVLGSDQPAFAGPTRYFRCKRAVDVVVATPLLCIATPVMLLVALTILLVEGRPILYRQTRVGKQGRRFWIYKFRSMRRDAEKCTGPVWAADNDRRITTLGRWLRKSHLDELPQLLNVLKGEMSLIGPRPERPQFVAEFSECIPDYPHRLTVRPGLTGLAQLHLGYDRCIQDVVCKVRLDLHYIENATLLTDVALLIQTIPYLLGKTLVTQRDDTRGRGGTEATANVAFPRIDLSQELTASRFPRATGAVSRPQASPRTSSDAVFSESSPSREREGRTR